MKHVSVLERLAGHKVAANVLMLLAFVLGVIGLTRMNVQFFPTFELDVISVRVVWSGAAAEDVENGITVPLEERLKTVDGLKRMSSTSAQGVASITLELHEGTDALLASALGLLAGQGLTALLGGLWMADQGLAIVAWHWPTALAGVPVAALGVALAAAAVPAVSAYRVDVTSLLQTR